MDGEKLGLWSTLIIYLIAIPLGIKKAVTDGSSFDIWTSFAVIVGSAIPVFLFAVFLIVFFAGGTYLHWFPLHGLTSDNWEEMSWLGKIADYFWHITLPVTAMVIGGFASLTMLTKNSFLDEINKQYVLTAKNDDCASVNFIRILHSILTIRRYRSMKKHFYLLITFICMASALYAIQINVIKR